MEKAEIIIPFRSFYYGWIIVGVGLISMIFWGIRGCFSVFYVTLLEEFPWSRGGAAGVQSLALITNAIVAPIIGWLIDRFGPRRIVIPGVLVLSFSLVSCALIKTLAQFYILYGVFVASGITCIGIVAYAAILAHWFEKKRGLANGIAVSGMGVGILILVPLSQYLISNWGWRIAFVGLAGLVLTILLPLNTIFLKHKPEEVGQYKDGLKNIEKLSSGKRVAEEPKASLTLQKAIHTKNFWALIAFPTLAVLGIFIVLVHNVKFLVDAGLDKMTVAFYFALIGAICSVFRAFWGWLSDYLGREKTYTLGTLFLCGGVYTLLLIETMDERWLVYLFLILFGIGWGVTAPTFMSATADLYKGKAIGLIYGIVEGSMSIGGAFGAWVGGYIFDKAQSYRLAFIIAIIAFILSCFFIWLSAPRNSK
jgi:MFS family permease